MEGETSVFKVFLSDSSAAQLASQERTSERIVEQIVDSRVLGGGLGVLQRLLRVLVNTLVKGFFALFPVVKKSAKLASHSGSELLIESSPSTPVAQLEDSIEWVQLWERPSTRLSPGCDPEAVYCAKTLARFLFIVRFVSGSSSLLVLESHGVGMVVSPRAVL